MRSSLIPKLSVLGLTASVLMMSGCATNPAHFNQVNNSNATANAQDPLEKLNRKIFSFNMRVDRYVFRPLAKGYDKITPDFVQARVTNFFGNLAIVPTLANDILQFNVYHTFADTSRLVINSTLGVGGLFDVAQYGDLPHHHNDFGITLAKYGVKHSPYFVMPFFGPYTVRDAVGFGVDFFLSVWPYIPSDYLYETYAALAIDKINKRAALLSADKLVDQAYDPYVFLRDAYLQNRQSEIDANLGKSDADTFVSTDATTNTNTNNTSSNTDSTDTFVSADDSTNTTNNAANTATAESETPTTAITLPKPTN